MNEEKKVIGPVLGIDLGTTNSCVAVMIDGKTIVIPNQEGGMTTPSVINKENDGSVVVGAPAKRKAILQKDTFHGTKRFIGKTYEEYKNSVKSDLLPYKIVKGPNGECLIESSKEEKISPVQIGSYILKYLKDSAEKYLGQKISNAIITVPAYFDDSQRQATKSAGEVAGLNVLRIINEPTAAALAYGLDKKGQRNKTILVFDLGGGTFDISILKIGDGVFEVISTGGDTNLGGDDFNNKIVDFLIKSFKNENNIDLNKIEKDKLPQVLQRLYEAAERAKIELSSKIMTEISLPFLYGNYNLEVSLSRTEFNNLVKDLVDRAFNICNEVIKKSNCELSSIEEIVMVGGQTRMPMIQEMIKKKFDKDPCLTVNPDEVVAIGASIQGGVLRGDVTDVLLLDVIPLSLGIETLGNIFTKMVEANTAIPTKKTMIFSTAQDNQTTVTIRVFQGERTMAEDNKLLGSFDLEGIPPAPRGVPQIEVTFDIDVSGILNVTAKDLVSNKEQNVKIHQSIGSLAPEEIKRMKEEAEKSAEADKKKLDLAVLRNEADSLIGTAQTAIAEDKKVSNELKEEIQERIKKLQEALSSKDFDSIKGSKEDLSKKLSEVYEYTKNTMKDQQTEAKNNTDSSTEDSSSTSTEDV